MINGVLGVYGQICSGKSTLTASLKQVLPGWFNDGFAWELKFDIVKLALGFTEQSWAALTFETRVQIMQQALNPEMKPYYRSMLQGWGTLGQKLYGETYWVERLLDRVLEHHLPGNVLMIDDVRFPHEVTSLRQWGKRMGIPVVVLGLEVSLLEQQRRHLRMYGERLTPEARLHRSETALVNYAGFDATFDADVAVLELRSKVLSFLSAWESGLRPYAVAA